MPIDYTKFPTSDLEALVAGDYSKVSTKTLESLVSSSGVVKPGPSGVLDPVTTVKKPFQHAYELARPAISGLAAGAGAALGGAVGWGIPGAIGGGTAAYVGAEEALQAAGERLGFVEPSPLEERLPREVVEGALFSGLPAIAGPAARLIGKAGAPVLGGISGKGTYATKLAFKRPPAFAKGFEAKVNFEDIHNELKTAIKTTHEMMETDYRTSLQAIKQYKDPLDIRPIQAKITSLLDQFNLTYKIGGRGKRLQYVLSPKEEVAPLTQTEITELEGFLKKWEQIEGNPRAQTPFELNNFKQNIDRYFKEEKRSQPFLTELRNTVDQVIGSAVPEYKPMTSQFHTMSSLLRELKDATGNVATKTNVDATISKLTSILKREPTRGRELLQQLNILTGRNIPEQLAGLTMREPLPQGGFGRYIAASETAGMLLGHLNSKFLLLLGMSSPYIQGRFLQVLGSAYKGAKFIPPAALTATLPTAVSPLKGEHALLEGAVKELIYNPQTKQLEEAK